MVDAVDRHGLLVATTFSMTRCLWYRAGCRGAEPSRKSVGNPSPRLVQSNSVSSRRSVLFGAVPKLRRPRVRPTPHRRPPTPSRDSPPGTGITTTLPWTDPRLSSSLHFLDTSPRTATRRTHLAPPKIPRVAGSTFEVANRRAAVRRALLLAARLVSHGGRPDGSAGGRRWSIIPSDFLHFPHSSRGMRCPHQPAEVPRRDVLPPSLLVPRHTSAPWTSIRPADVTFPRRRCRRHHSHHAALMGSL
ncbi:uncharacterized protein J3D65DRAFT_82265 [Phyllosticta citribraziliensis]|uniref:Uncharacterized protein n=1 Tax=Phyllosticta citribraziliensis TaxID=989973 RepID=A0ABR1LEB7_9PEZI